MALALSILVLLLFPMLLSVVTEIKCLRAEYYNLLKRVEKLENDN